MLSGLESLEGKQGGIHGLLSRFSDSELEDLLHAASASADQESSRLHATPAAGPQLGGFQGKGGGRPPTKIHVKTEVHTQLHVNFLGRRPPCNGSAAGAGAPSRWAGEQGVGSAEGRLPRMSAAERLATAFQYSMVRILTITENFDWFRPFFPGEENEAIGSGFAVVLDAKGSRRVPHNVEEDPVFVTNAHVVRNAHTVRIQLPAMGQQDFGAYVPLIFDKLDLALVRLQDPEAFLKNLKENSVDLQILPVKEDPPMSMGMEVAALGFPLGSPSLKLSRGVIAGTEQVDGKVCFQSTAPISPGSSGGPLFAVEALSGEEVEPRVIGVNFASSASATAQNNNYVIPLVHIRQLLNQFEELDEQDQRQYEEWKKKYEAALAGQAGDTGSFSDISLAEASSASPGGRVPSLSSAGSPGLSAGRFRRPPGAAARWPERAALAQLRPEVAGTGFVGPRERALFRQRGRLLSNGGATLGRQASGLQLGGSQGRRRDDPPEGGSPPLAGLPKRAAVHHALRIAPIAAVAVESNSVLYKGGCKKGVYISKTPKPSVFDTVPAPSFLVAVNGAPLDQFGMGRHAGYLDSPLPFNNLMTMQERLEDPVKLTVCQDGLNTDFTVNMAWSDSAGNKSKYDLGVPVVEEPYWHPTAKDFEVFAGVTVAEMTVNHILYLLPMMPELGGYMSAEARKAKKLIVVHTEPGTYASRVLEIGMVVAKINGKNVTGLDTWIASVFFSESGPEAEFKLETAGGVVFNVPFGESFTEQLGMAQQIPKYSYLDTKAICLRDAYLQYSTNLASPETVDMIAATLKKYTGKEPSQADVAAASKNVLGSNLARECKVDAELVNRLLDQT